VGPGMARILLAEDEFLIRMMLAEELTAAGHDVVEANDAAEALALFDIANVWDLLVTDIQMPGSLDGLALANRIRASHPSMPVVYLTGRPEAMAMVGTLGANDALMRKPFAPSEVVAVVQRLLDRD
jgi:DNA-binding response OmpR family regulator